MRPNAQRPIGNTNPELFVNVVVMDPAFLGDVVFSGVLVEALRRLPQVERIGFVVRPPADALVRKMPRVDAIHVFDKYGKDSGLLGLLRIAKRLEAENYQIALIPHASLRSRLLTKWARIPIRIGFRNRWLGRLGLTHPAIDARALDFVSARLALVSQLTSLSDLADRSLAGVFGPRLHRALEHAAPPAHIGLALGANFATKRWSLYQAGQLILRLKSEGYRLTLLGSEKERYIWDQLGALTDLADVNDALGGSVDQLLENISKMDVLVAGDTGPLHMARAWRIPVVALFGPTSEKAHFFSERDRIMTLELECRPCSAHGQNRCPLKHHRCLQELTADDVYFAVKSALAK